jgi:hypothetical protein
VVWRAVLQTVDVEPLMRRPVVTAVVAALLALVVVDAARRAVDGESRAEHWWPVVVLIVAVVYGSGTFVFFSSERGRSKLAQGSKSSPSLISQTLLALAMCPVILCIAAVFAGAPTWLLWVAFGLTCLMLARWAAQVRTGRT